MKYKQMLMKEGGSGDNTSTPLRDERIDSVKYWLIVLVIAGHVFARPIFSETPACTVIWKWIYMFHMPLFVFLSGFFSKKKNREKLYASIWKLLEPYIIFQTIRLLPKIIKGTICITDILTPEFALWYLLALIFWRLLLQIIPDRILNNAKLIISIAFIISISAGFFPFNSFLTLQRTLAFMPFFFLGYCMKGKNLFLPTKFKPLCFVFLVLTMLIPIFFQNYIGTLQHRDPYDNCFEAVTRTLIFALSIPMSLAFINLCPNSSWVAKQGKLSLQYYIYHTFIVTMFVVIVSKFNLPVSLLAASLYTLAITIGIGIASYFPYFKEFTNPSTIIRSFILRKKEKV